MQLCDVIMASSLFSYLQRHNQLSLTERYCETLVHAFISTNGDSYNSFDRLWFTR